MIINNNKSAYAINRDSISCDLYDYLEGRLDAGKVDTEKYMEQYTWAML